MRQGSLSRSFRPAVSVKPVKVGKVEISIRVPEKVSDFSDPDPFIRVARRADPVKDDPTRKATPWPRLPFGRD